MKVRMAVVSGWLLMSVSAAVGQVGPGVDVWRTNADRTKLLVHERLESGAAGADTRSATGGGVETIAVDAAQRFQIVDGFGFAMTGGSAQLLHGMSAAKRHALLKELFGRGAGELGVSYLRVSIGASDMNERVYTYDDQPTGGADKALAHFTLAEDEKDVIPVLKEVLGIAPRMEILASPWTAPAWMKTNDAVKGGTLKPELYGVYAAYLVKYLQGMAAEGVPIAALTMQNEPLNPKNTPSMVLEAAQEEAFLRDALGPALRAAGLKTKVVLYDHNCDRPDYPETILKDAQAARYADGSGFHLYGGEISAMSEVHDAFPAKNLYFTEQMVVERAVLNKGADGVLEPVAKPVSAIVIGAMRNWSRTVLLWNLAANAEFGPHTSDGGCPVCQGAITIEGDTVTRNIALYTVAHASEFVPPGSVRIGSTATAAGLSNVAWVTPAGRYVLLVANTGGETREFGVEAKGRRFRASVAKGEVATFVW